MTELTPAASGEIKQISEALIESYSNQPTPPEESADPFTDEQKSIILDRPEVHWALFTNGRIVTGLGRTIDGQLALQNSHPVVVKFEPWAETVAHSKNQHATEVFSQACEMGDAELFAELAGYDEETYQWIAMEECLPLFTDTPAQDEYGDEYLVDAGQIRQFEEALEVRGWVSQESSRGELGLTNDDRIVSIDYGANVEVDIEAVSKP